MAYINLSGINDPNEVIEAVICFVEAKNLTLSWKVVSGLLKEGGRDPKMYGPAWHLKTDHVGAGVYVRKGSPAFVISEKKPRAQSKAEGLSWSPTFLAPDQERESWYSEDAGLRRLALTQTKCFSSYSEGEKACAVCPLARFCQEASFAKMDELARLLDQQEEARMLQEQEALNAPAPVTSSAPVTLEVPVTSEVPVAPVTSSSSVQEVLASLQSRGMTASSPPMPFKGVCSGCSSTVEAGSTVVHVKGRGMFHPDCAAKL